MKLVEKPRKIPKQARSRSMVDAILEATARVLVKRGYSGTNTNLIAEVAGVSVGSIYQYFPNKESLIVALHQRHAIQMQDMIIHLFSRSKKTTLRGAMKALVKAVLEAHLVEPKLHYVLEWEFPLLDLHKDVNSADYDIPGQVVQAILKNHRDEIRRPNLELAVYIVIKMIKSLVHQTVLEPSRYYTQPEIEDAISEAAFGYLTIPPE
jgi:AcrR family transcriptional regulator